MPEHLFNHLVILDESEDSHLALAPGAGQGINLINPLNQPRPILPIFLGGSLRLQNAGYPFILALFLPFPPVNITVIPIIPDSRLQRDSPLSGTWELMAAITTLGSDGPHMVGTWGDYIRSMSTKDDEVITIPARRFNKTEEDL
jgi:hypothetical protein